jgi:hypothetical protein
VPARRFFSVTIIMAAAGEPLTLPRSFCFRSAIYLQSSAGAPQSVRQAQDCTHARTDARVHPHVTSKSTPTHTMNAVHACHVHMVLCAGACTRFAPAP